MARVRSPNRDKAFEIYKLNNGEILLKDIATQLGVKDTQIRKWKSQDKWEEKLKGTLPKNKRNVINKKTDINKQAINEEIELVLKNDKLTEKQKLFCIYYIENFNATKAYQRAYECSYATAMSEGSKSLRNPKIKIEIDRLTNECLEEQEINSKLLSKRLWKKYIDIAFADITDYLEFNSKEVQGEYGTYTKNTIRLKNSDEVDGSLISEISEGRDGIKIKLQDKMKALQWLSDRMDLLPTSVKTKLDIEMLKLEVEMNKHDNTQEEVENDGFIEALNNATDEVWNDE
jgi:phage terminase small subunit|nr:MAG TPA: Terminase small subunit [Caudoviricetes sp.]